MKLIESEFIERFFVCGNLWQGFLDELIVPKIYETQRKFNENFPLKLNKK
jgi:hypothetical protein